MHFLSKTSFAFTCCSSLLVALAGGCSSGASSDTSNDELNSTGQDSSFEAIDCAAFEPVQQMLAGVANAAAILPTLSCGTLTAPENRSGKDSRTVKLPILVAKATNAAPGSSAPPLVMITGGPSTPSLEFMRLIAPGMPAAGLRRDRDVILVGERGERWATPRISCPKLDDLVKDLFGSDGTLHPITGAQKIPILKECAAEHRAKGVDLGAYNMREMAADVRDAARALGAQKFHLYGVSFGTILSQQIAKLYPESVASVMLDSPAVWWDEADREHLLTGNLHLDASRAVTEAFKALFATCQADPACDAKYPNLEALLRETIADLDENPIDLEVPGPQRPDGSTYRAKIDGALTYAVLTNSFGAGQVGIMPAVINGLRARDPQAFELIKKKAAAALTVPKEEASGLTLSVDCSAWSTVDPESVPTAGVDALAVRYLRESVKDELVQCRDAWQVPSLRASWAEGPKPLASNTLPALIFPGKFDANTPPIKGELIHRHLPRSFVHVVPDRGHVTISECPVSMMVEFMRDPSRDPDATCLSQMTLTWL